MTIDMCDLATMDDVTRRAQAAARKVAILKAAIERKISTPSIKCEMNLKVELDFVRTIRELMNDAEDALLNTARSIGCIDALVPPFVLDNKSGVIHHDVLSSILLDDDEEDTLDERPPIE